MKKLFAFLLPVVLSAGFCACAGTVPTADFKKPIAAADRLCSGDEIVVKLTAAEGVSLNEISRQRLGSLLAEAVNNRKKNTSCKKTDKRSYLLNSRITRYDQGKAFARAVLAGLGQIHIDGDFSLFVMPKENEPVAEFAVQKTFAWGGLYGGMARMEDIEPVFAESVAHAIVTEASQGRDQSPANQEEKDSGL